MPETPPAPVATPAPDRKAHSSPENVDPELRRAMDDAAAYLARACGPEGRFVYRIRLNPDERALPSYNVLRHAGAIYALAQYQALWPSPEIAAAIGRATSHLWTYARRPDGEPEGGRLAIWSAKRDDVAKLGGAGLAMVAMGQLRPIAPNLVDGRRLSEVAAFVRSLQKPDGSFYSKHFRGQGPDDSWTSLYYPGEAALGLVLIGGDDNRRAALDALSFLARSRHSSSHVPPDHWALIATGALLERPSDRPVSDDVRAQLQHHARQIVDQMLSTAPDGTREGVIAGSWGGGGRTTPTATRLEGLVAALGYLTEPEDAARRRRMSAVIERGIDFLLRARVSDGPHRGAMPRSITWDEPTPSSPRADEVRIDYVQHALSAWIGWALHQASGPPGGQ